MLRFGLIIALVVVALDQLTKYWVLGPAGLSPPGCLERIGPCGEIEISGIFDIRMVWNRGVSFGFLPADSDIARWGLTLGQTIIAGVFFWWLRSTNERMPALGLSLVVGGAVGNIIDRVRFGAVTDFLDFSGLFFPWVFNVADSAISVGGAILVVYFVFVLEDPPGTGTLWGRFAGWVSGGFKKPGNADS